MPKKVERRFLRQRRAPTPEKIGVVIPGNATMKPELAERADSLDIDLGKPTEPPFKFSFHYIDFPPDEFLLENGATADSGVYEFTVRDAVIGVFDLPALESNEFSWSFSTTSQIDVLTALRVGETFDVDFEEELEEAYHATRTYARTI